MEKVYTQGESQGDANGAQPTHSPNGHPTQPGTDAAPIYSYSRFKSTLDNTPKAAGDTWPQLCELLAQRAIRDEKDGPLFSGASYPPGATRGNEGVSFVAVAILDFDGGTTLEEIKAGVSRLNSGDGCAAFIYTTHSHNPDAGALKYRLVLPLREPVAGSDWRDVWKRLALHFGNTPDPSRKDAAGMHYLPSCPPEREAFAVAVQLDGPPLSVATLPDLPPEPTRAPYSAPENQGGDPYARRAFEAEIGRLCATTAGRNQALNDTARRLGQFIGAGRLDRSEVEDALWRAAAANGYVAKDGEAAARATLKSGLDAGEREPNYKGMPDARPTVTTAKSRFDSGEERRERPRDAPRDDDEKPRFELFSLDDLELLPRPEWLVQNILVQGTTSIISADSGSFKSFVALELALCIATGTPFHGRDVKGGNVVYVAAEGFYTLRDRATAWLQSHGLERPQNFHILRAPVAIAEAGTVHAFADELAKFNPALIVLDTLSQCALGLNENSNDEMARFVAGMMQLGTRSGAHVCAVHHNAKAGGFRGASAIHANVDARISLERPEGDATNTVFVRCEKQRGKPFAPFALRGEEIVLPYSDEYGEEITSLVFQLAGAADIPTVKHPNAKKADKTAARLLEVFDKVALEGAQWGGVKVGFWKEAVEEADPKICEERAFWRHRKALEKSGEIVECSEHNGSPLYRRGGPTVTTVITVTTAKSQKDSCDSEGANPEKELLSQLSQPFRGDSYDSSSLEAGEVATPKKKHRAKNDPDSEPYGAVESSAPDADELREGAL
jgi:hypothetical protein